MKVRVVYVAVSYTHLDVYKRQDIIGPPLNGFHFLIPLKLDFGPPKLEKDGEGHAAADS